MENQNADKLVNSCSKILRVNVHEFISMNYSTTVQNREILFFYP